MVPVPAVWATGAQGKLQVARARWNGTWVDGLNGRIDGVRVYNRALTQPEVAIIYSPPSAVAKYDFEESGGTSAADTSDLPIPRPLALASGNGGSAPVLGTTGRVDRGLTVSAASQQYAATTAAVVPARQSFSVAAWVRTTDIGRYQDAVSQIADAGSYFWLGYDGAVANGAWVFGVNTGAGHARVLKGAGVTSSPSPWTYLVGVYDRPRQQVRFFVNGALVGTAAYTADYAPSAMGALQVGRGRDGAPTYYWSGSIDQVRLYNRALTDSEANALYNGSTGVGSEPESVDLAGAAANQPGALQGAQQGLQSSTAVAFSGVSNGYDKTL